MQVFLNHINPFGIPGLIIQLLSEHIKGILWTVVMGIIRKGYIWCLVERIRSQEWHENDIWKLTGTQKRQE